MDADRERWAEALLVERQHGPRAPAFIAGRVAALVLAGDLQGVARWRAIAERYDQLTRGPRQ
ncbi:DUF6961 family protein [Sphingomonas sp. PB4P5]|uniref:DUF6961 family protein n=1 Tax=Parasphingomonas puruogangriensis TaxID=3096155 RepID=UPI002FC5FD1B